MSIVKFHRRMCFATHPSALPRRRKFLLGAAMAALAAAWPWSPASAARPIPLPLDPASARAIGRRYLDLAPGEADRSHLLKLLHLPDPRLQAWPKRDDLVRHLGALRDREFFSGDSVLIDGWVLSRSEARICALYCL